MTRVTGCLIALVAAAAVAACGNDDDGAAGAEAGEESSAPDEEAQAPEEQAGESGDEPVGARLDELGEIGVPACDDYVESYMACISQHIPSELSAEYLEAFKATQDAWREDAEDEEARETLAETCAQAEKAAMASMEQYDCDW